MNEFEKYIKNKKKKEILHRAKRVEHSLQIIQVKESEGRAF